MPEAGIAGNAMLVGVVATSPPAGPGLAPVNSVEPAEFGNRRIDQLSGLGGLADISANCLAHL